MHVEDGSHITVWFSCGAASAVAAKKTLEQYADRCTVRIVNNPVVEEDEDNRRFLHDVEKWLGVEIEFAVNPAFPSASARDVWEKRKYMSGVAGAPCTYELKKRARQIWESQNRSDYLVLGFTAEEKKRYDRFIETERDTLLPVLIENRISKKECFMILQQAGIELPRVYKMGYPNANCIGCVKATSGAYWNLVRKNHPEVFQDRLEQSERLGVKLTYYKGKRIPLKELPVDAKGRLRQSGYECGIFCEEKI